MQRTNRPTPTLTVSDFLLSPESRSGVEFAVRSIPGGIRLIVHLASLSSDPRLQSVAAAWNAGTPGRTRARTHIDQLCTDAGISQADFIGNVAATAFELGMDVSVFVGMAQYAAESLKYSVNRALNDPQDRFWKPTEERPKSRNRAPASPEYSACINVARMRAQWRLSQSQFARLFITTVRTVKRWEAGRSGLTAHQRFFLELFMKYVERNGIRELRKRFVE
jgi:DNA-binding transcriptional regulator YiaG